MLKTVKTRVPKERGRGIPCLMNIVDVNTPPPFEYRGWCKFWSSHFDALVSAFGPRPELMCSLNSTDETFKTKTCFVNLIVKTSEQIWLYIDGCQGISN